ncbi:hypothetical protein [Streptomyces orinoci]|uniref:Small hydrophobic membrane protein n=1 Tax=Streptomyces orinoci TaxID=67339 RepID=A0ABV3K3E8_STRON|nr:hypothetical protein [Streptomyces orinoci]
MFFLVLALFLLGVFSGTAAHLPASLTLLCAAGVGLWLLLFAVRERHTRQRNR